MAKNKTTTFETPVGEIDRSLGKGILGLMILSLVGFLIWFLVYNHESH